MPDNPMSFTSRRVPALDGFRGLLTLVVLLSHYFAEIGGGFHRFALGFFAVDGFFVLSGLLVGRLLLERGDAANFMFVFYVRRVLRTFPIYFVCLALALAGAAAAGLTGDPAVPAWSYFAFVNNLFSAATGSVGRPWLSPTWTMAVEEQFYLVAPALMIFTPRRYRLPALGAVIAAAILARCALAWAGATGTALTMLLPTRADDLAIGLAAAVLLEGGIDWRPRVWICLAANSLALTLGALSGAAGMALLGHTLIGLGVAVYLMAIVQGAPLRRSLEGRVLRYCGETSYAVYLTHMPVLWLAHAALRGAAPTLASTGGFAVSLACIPVVFALAHVLTRCVEAPITALGRRFAWAPAQPGAAVLKPRRA